MIRLKLSNFFRPDLRKLVIFVIIFFLLPIPIVGIRGCFGDGPKAAICTYWVIAPFAGVYLITGYAKLLVMPVSPSYEYFPEVPDIYFYQIPTITVISLLVSYVMASVIVWYYERLR